MKSVLVAFRPLSHIELEADTPLRVRIVTGKKEVFAVFKPQTAMNYVRLYFAKEAILSGMGKAAGTASKETGMGPGSIQMMGLVLSTVELLWELVEKPSGWWARRRFEKQFNEHFRNNVGEAYQLFQRVLEHSGRIENFLKRLRSFELIQAEPFEETGRGASSRGLTPMYRVGSGFSPSAN